MGLSVAKILAQKGANVAIIARDRAKLAHALTELEVRLSSCSLSPLGKSAN